MNRISLGASKVLRLVACAALLVGCAIDSDDMESTSAQSLRCRCRAPALPTAFVATAGLASASLSWTANATIDRVIRYQVYRDDALIADGPTSTSFVDTGLTAGTAYTYRVSALNANGYGPWTDALTVVPFSATPTVVPSIPSGLVATGGSQQVSLSWGTNPAADQVIRYQVYRDDDLIADGPTATSFVDTGLTSGDTHTYRVSALNVVGYGAWTDAFTAGPTVPSGGGTIDGGTSSGGVPGIGLVHYGNALPNASHQSSYSFVIVSRDDGPAAALLPGTSVIYSEGTGIMEEWNTGVAYSQAVANGWLLTDGAGNYLRSSYGEYLADVGSSAYQQAWITNVAAFVGSVGVKGTFIDNVVRDPRSLFGVLPAKYPTISAWAQAMVSFVSAVGPALQARGIYVLGNVSGFTGGAAGSDNGTLDAQWYQQVGPYLSGLMNEFYMQTPTGILRASGSSSWTQNWDGWQQLIGVTQSMGKDFIGLTYGSAGDTPTMTYGRASFLMEWNGGHSAFIFNPNDNSDPWNPAWTRDLGQPTQPKQSVGVGWMRQYANGVALVNPSPSSAQTFSLPRSYVTESGQTVTSVTLQPTTGALLH